MICRCGIVDENGCRYCYPCPRCNETLVEFEEECKCGNDIRGEQTLGNIEQIEEKRGPLFGVEFEHPNIHPSTMLKIVYKLGLWSRIHQVKRDGTLPDGREITFIPDRLDKMMSNALKLAARLNEEPFETCSPAAIHFHIMKRDLSTYELTKWRVLGAWAYHPFEHLRESVNSRLTHFQVGSGKRAETVRFCKKGSFESIELRIFPANYNPVIVEKYFEILKWLIQVHKEFKEPFDIVWFETTLRQMVNQVIELWYEKGGEK